MLHTMTMRGVGPSALMQLALAPRLNLITGDNGLGKSFLLDAAWWGLTRTWAGEEIRPPRPAPLRTVERAGTAGTSVGGPPAAPEMDFELDTAARARDTDRCRYDRASQQWKCKPGRGPHPGLVLYARVDGGFCVWDPARNHAPDLAGGSSDARLSAAFVFDAHDIWHGLKVGDEVHCKRLLVDWVEWQSTRDPAFEELVAVLRQLSPDPTTPLRPGEPTRVSLRDVRDMPTLAMPYGDVPILHASAAMRRVTALAYLLVWSLREHRKAQEFLGNQPVGQIVFLVDELESHLHPRWQRTILPALLDVTERLSSKAGVQIVATTHSPFVPLSVETRVDEAHDALWDLDLVGNAVTLTRRPWERRGDAAGWVTSEVFDLESTRSTEGEALLGALDALYLRAQGEALAPAEIDAMDARLRAVLPELDPVFARWMAFKERLRTGGAGATP